MKTVDFKYYISLVLIVFACIFAVSCQEEVEKPLQDQDGMVFLDEGKMVKANTNFTTDDIIYAIKEASWKIDHHETLIYDNNRIEYFEKPKQNVNGDLFPTIYHFINDSIFTNYNYPLVNCPYVVDGKGVTLYEISPYSKRDTISSYTYKVIALDPRRIVMDVNYQTSLSTKFRPLPEGYNAETSKVRYIWRKYDKDKPLQ